ncbi:MAG: cation-transporting P-type ATPase, partial [Alphaproteobacteria bacterium]|nr:cation-transporting P-type ATPase [Alphaproteobacteria bacterium]
MEKTSVLAKLVTDQDGLDTDAVAHRLEKYGSNMLPRPEPDSLAQVFFRQFKSPMVYLLLIGAIVSIAISEYLDANFIVVVLLLNALIGTLQEWKAQKNAEGLHNLVPHKSLVKRDGSWRTIPSEQLVPGDYIIVESGVRVAADIRLINQRELKVDEALLTGEAGAVSKSDECIFTEDVIVGDRLNMLFA